MAAHGRVRRNVSLTPEQRLHERLMKEVLKRLRGSGLVLRGGSAVAFAYGGNRHSTDLDLDGEEAVELRSQIRAAGRAAGVRIGFIERREGRFRQRFRARYRSRSGAIRGRLKVDYHFHEPPRSGDTHFVGGFLTYRVEVLFGQKMAAAENRLEARDLFDLAFLMSAYGNQLTDDQVRRADAFLTDPDKVEQRYADAFLADAVLKRLTTVSRTVARFRAATARQRQRRWPHKMHQRSRVPEAVLGHAFAYASRQRWKTLGPTTLTPLGTTRPLTSRRSDRHSDRSSSRSRSADLDHSPSR